MERMLRLKEVMSITGLGKSTIYKLIGEGKFPKQKKISVRAVGWRQSDVVDWLPSRTFD